MITNFKDVNNFLNVLNILDTLSKSKADIFKKNSEWLLLTEEKLELLLVKAFNDSKDMVLGKLNQLEKFTSKTFVLKNIVELNDILLEPRYKFTQIGQTRFKEFTFSVEIRNWMSKSNIGETISSISYVNPDPFMEPITDAQMKSMQFGGQSVFNIFDIGIEFALRDKNVEKYYENYAIKLSEQIAKELQSKIKYEILDSIKNAESIPKIRQRILEVYNKPIDIVVKPKLDETGNIIRQGYNYQMSPQHWATTTARTEVMAAYTDGRLIGYKQSGVVDRVEFSVSADERLCELCAPLEGSIYKLSESKGIIPVHPNCLIHPDSPIYTVDGWKKIIEIKVGDLVLTHTGKFRKVIQLHRNKYDGEIVKLFFSKKGMDNGKSISLTANHPLLINDKWIEASEVRVGDKAKILVHPCNYKEVQEFEDIEISNAIYYIEQQVATYNLSVEDDESYVYNNIIVHNCRCQFIPLIAGDFEDVKQLALKNIQDIYEIGGNAEAADVPDAAAILEQLKAEYKHISFSGMETMSGESIEDLKQVLKELSELFGKDIVNNNKTISAFGTYERYLKLPVKGGTTITSSEYANSYAFRSPYGIYFNEQKFFGKGQYNSLLGAIKNDIATGWHPAETVTSSKSVIHHEIMHQIDNAYFLESKKGKILRDKWMETDFFGKSGSFISENVSIYAKKNPEEFLAELWSQYMVAPDKMTPWAKEVAEKYVKYIKKVAKPY